MLIRNISDFRNFYNSNYEFSSNKEPYKPNKKIQRRKSSGFNVDVILQFFINKYPTFLQRVVRIVYPLYRPVNSILFRMLLTIRYNISHNIQLIVKYIKKLSTLKFWKTNTGVCCSKKIKVLLPVATTNIRLNLTIWSIT